MIQNYHTEFLTATIFNWYHLLKEDTYKQIVTDSFQWLVNEKKCIINAFVIMPNHIHMLWKISDGFQRKEVEGALFSFTAHMFKRQLKRDNIEILEEHFVGKTDRDYQFWQREPMVKECWTKKFFQQKLDYTHFNPCQPHWNLADIPESYKFSSARFYETGIKDFAFLTHYNDA